MLELLIEFLNSIIVAVFELIPLALTVFGLLLAFTIIVSVASKPWKYKNIKAWLNHILND